MNAPATSELEYLRKSDIFQGLSNQALQKIFSSTTHKKCKNNDFIFMQGAPAKRFYIVKSGRLKLFQTTSDGERVTLRYLGPGDAFGVIVVLRETEYPVTAQAAEDCELWGWGDQEIKQIMFAHPQVAINSISILSDYILGFMERIQGLSTQKVDQRVARALLRFAETTGQQSGDMMTIGLKLTRQDIAEITGTTLFTVSRTLSAWEAKGWIDCSNSHIRIQTPEQLRQIGEN